MPQRQPLSRAHAREGGILLKSATKAELEELRQFIDELDLAITDKTTKERWDELKGLAKLPPEDLTPYAELIAQGLAYEGPSGSNDWMVREEALKLLDKLSNDAVLQHADAFATSLFETTKSNKRDTAVAAKLDRLAPDLAKQVPEVVRHQSHEKELARQVARAVCDSTSSRSVLARRISSSNSSDGDSIFLSFSRDASHAELLGQVVKIDPSIAERTVQNGERKGERYADVGMKECKDAIRVAIGDKARLDSEARRRELEALADLSPEELKSHAELIAQGLAYEGPSGSNDWMVREEALKLLDKLSNDAVLQHADAFATSSLRPRRATSETRLLPRSWIAWRPTWPNRCRRWSGIRATRRSLLGRWRAVCDSTSSRRCSPGAFQAATAATATAFSCRSAETPATRSCLGKS